MTRHRNDGLRKRCGCPRRKWAKCPDAWHLNFKWRGEVFRFSLARRIGRLVKVESDGRAVWTRDSATLGKPITSKTEAETEAEWLRTGIREGGSLLTDQTTRSQRDTLTLEQLFDTYRTPYFTVHRPTTLKATKYQVGLVLRTELVRADGERRGFGEWLVQDITTDTIEQYRQVRLAAGMVATNRDLGLLRCLFNWATSSKRKLATENPFLDGSTPAIKLQRETPRRRRLASGEGERLLAACGRHLRGSSKRRSTGEKGGAPVPPVVAGAVSPGGNLPAREKNEDPGRSPDSDVRFGCSSILEMRRYDPEGKEHPATAYMFGNEVGEAASRSSAPGSVGATARMVTRRNTS